MFCPAQGSAQRHCSCGGDVLGRVVSPSWGTMVTQSRDTGLARHRVCGEGAPAPAPALPFPAVREGSSQTTVFIFPQVSSILTYHSKSLKHMLTENVYKQEKCCSFASNCQAMLGNGYVAVL